VQVRKLHGRSIIVKLVTFAKFLITDLRTLFFAYYFLGVTAFTLLSGCSLLAPLSKQSGPVMPEASRKASPEFLRPVAVDQPASQVAISNSSAKVRKAAPAPVGPSVSNTVPVQPAPLRYTAPQIESASAVQLKYAVLLDTEVEQLPPSALLEQIDPWMGVPYRSGGNTKAGVDCSSFTMQVFEQCYGWKLPRTSKQQYSFCERTDAAALSYGDLLFYATRGRSVSHVGIYLGNGKFVHASVSSGVTVSDIADPYYQKRFISAGRIPAGFSR
jgi:lipoprotein Spr